MSVNGQPENDRLDRVEAILVSLAESHEQAQARLSSLDARQDRTQAFIDALGVKQDRTQAQIDALNERSHLTDDIVRENRESVREFARIANALVQAVATLQTDVHDLKADVRGLRVEVSRILEHLLGRGEQ